MLEILESLDLDFILQKKVELCLMDVIKKQRKTPFDTEKKQMITLKI